MNNIKKYEDFFKMNETKKDEDKVYDFGCMMLYFDFPNIESIHEKIEQVDIFEEDGLGLKTESHCTLLYGFHDDEIEDEEKIFETCFDILGDSGDFKIKLDNVSLFENENDVLKFDVSELKDEVDGEVDILTECNKALVDNFPFTTDFPDFHPHCTIAYLKKGKGKKYVEMFESESYELLPKKLVYSKPDGTKIEKMFN